MKINQVEELVGITKKNIRFYEEQGLLCPERNADNGYREYSMKDVELLNKIRLLRLLDVPLDEIRKLEDRQITLQDCLERHIAHFSRRQNELDILKQLCKAMMESDEEFDSLRADFYLEDMKRLEKGGMRFMDVNQTDIRKTKRGPIIAAIVCILFFAAMIVVLLFSKAADPQTPWALIVSMALVFAAMIIGVIFALRQRLKEIDKGEINEAGKY